MLITVRLILDVLRYIRESKLVIAAPAYVLPAPIGVGSWTGKEIITKLNMFPSTSPCQSWLLKFVINPPITQTWGLFTNID